MGWIDEAFDHGCIGHFGEGDDERLAAFLTEALPCTGNPPTRFVMGGRARRRPQQSFELVDYFPRPPTLVGTSLRRGSFPRREE